MENISKLKIIKTRSSHRKPRAVHNTRKLCRLRARNHGFVIPLPMQNIILGKYGKKTEAKAGSHKDV